MRTPTMTSQDGHGSVGGLAERGASLQNDRALCPSPAATPARTFGLLALGRALLALRAYAAAEEVLAGLPSDTRGAALGVEQVRVALLMRATLQLGEASGPLAWASLVGLPAPDLGGSAAHGGAEIALTLGLCRLVSEDLAGATEAFDRVLGLAAAHDDEPVGLAQSWMALVGQAQAALRAGDARTAAELADTAREAAASGDAAWELAVSTLLRDAYRGLAGEDAPPEDLARHLELLSAPPTTGAPVDLIHGLPVEPPAVPSAPGTGLAAALVAAIPERLRALDPPGIALSAEAAACLFRAAGDAAGASDARKATREALARLANNG